MSQSPPRIPQRPSVPVPCGGRGAPVVQPKVPASARVPSVPAPCGGRGAPVVQPKAVVVARPPQAPAPRAGGAVQRVRGGPSAPVLPSPQEKQARDTSGMPVAAFEKVKAVALALQTKHGLKTVRFRFRPTNQDSLRWIKVGFSKKPHEVVTKSIGKLDTWLGRLMRFGGYKGGPADDTEGLIGFYNPMPESALDQLYARYVDQFSRRGRIPPEITLESLKKKRNDRAEEYRKNAASILKLEAQVPPVVRRGRGEYEGTLLDARPPERQGHAQHGSAGYFRPFTGDFDGFDILVEDPAGTWTSLAEAKKREPNGRWGKLYDEAIEALQHSHTVQLQHGFHLEWNIDADVQKQAREKHLSQEQADQLAVVYRGVDAGVRNKHKPGNEPLVDVSSDGKVGTSYYDEG